MLKGVAGAVGVGGAAIAAGCAAVIIFKEKDHAHLKGFSMFGSGRLIEVIVEQDSKFYEVWGLTCECGYMEPDGFVGASPTIGPATGWTRENVANMQQGIDKTLYREYIIDVRSDKFKKKSAKT